MRSVTVVEALVTYISLGWALVMLTNNDIFEQSANFDKLESIAHYEWVVGSVCLVLALVKIVGMALHNNRLRWLGLMMSTIFWVLVSATFLISGDQFEFNTGFIVYSGLAVMCLWTSKEVMSRDRTV